MRESVNAGERFAGLLCGWMSPAELTDALKAEARRLGFSHVGAARAEALDPEGDQLRAFVAAQKHGQMGWLADTAEVRADPRHPGMVPGALSVFVVAAPYARADGSVGPPPARVARYARGRDYHNVLRKPLRTLEKWLRVRGHNARHSVDSRPVLERAWAERAGVGFIGKNCCLIVPGLGSHVFLGCVVTTAALVPDAPMSRRCGRCMLCLDACPTRAFQAPRQLDARACISYLTIEHRGEIPERHRAPMGDWIFGCDVCQDVCPYNRTSLPPTERTAPYASDARLDTPTEALLSMDEEAFATWATGSPMKRTGRERMARNAALVLGNRGDRRHLPVLRAATTHDDAATRDAVRWAVARIESSSE